MGIGSIGWSEFLVVMVFALIFFGPRRLPQIASAVGKSLREFRKALNEVRTEIDQAGAYETRPQPTRSESPQRSRPATPKSSEGAETSGQASNTAANPEPSSSGEGATDADPGDPDEG